MGHDLYPHLIPAHESHAHPVAFERCGHAGDERHGAALEAFMLHRACHEVQDLFKTIREFRGFRRLRPPDHHFEPSGAPVEHPQNRLQLLFRIFFDFEDDDSVKFSGYFDGVGYVDVFRRIHLLARDEKTAALP